MRAAQPSKFRRILENADETDEEIEQELAAFAGQLMPQIRQLTAELERIEREARKRQSTRILASVLHIQDGVAAMMEALAAVVLITGSGDEHPRPQ